jgi:predicted DCC family thiol-disulfide oxidoreductase YuxK
VRFPITVFYDASCPLCADEIHMLKSRDDSDKLVLVDCSTLESPEFMRRLHVRDADGLWLVGVDAFRAIYSAVGLKTLGFLWLLLRPIYPWIARHRQMLSKLYCRNSQCSSRTRSTTVNFESPSGRTTAISPSAK